MFFPLYCVFQDSKTGKTIGRGHKDHGCILWMVVLQLPLRFNKHYLLHLQLNSLSPLLCLIISVISFSCGTHALAISPFPFYNNRFQTCVLLFLISIMKPVSWPNIVVPPILRVWVISIFSCSFWCMETCSRFFLVWFLWSLLMITPGLLGFTCWNLRVKFFPVFQLFHKLVETQFNTTLKVLHFSNGREYVSCFFLLPILAWHLPSNGLFWYSWAKWGGYEMKNRHLLDITRALLFYMHVP